MSVVQPHATQPGSPIRLDIRSFLMGGGAMLVIAWFGLLRPAQVQLAALERQVGHVARSVADLNGTVDGAKGTNALLTHLQIQARQLGDAEEAFARHERLVDRVSAQAAALEQAGAMLADRRPPRGPGRPRPERRRGGRHGRRDVRPGRQGPRLPRHRPRGARRWPSSTRSTRT